MHGKEVSKHILNEVNKLFESTLTYVFFQKISPLSFLNKTNISIATPQTLESIYDILCPLNKFLVSGRNAFLFYKFSANLTWHVRVFYAWLKRDGQTNVSSNYIRTFTCTKRLINIGNWTFWGFSWHFGMSLVYRCFVCWYN